MSTQTQPTEYRAASWGFIAQEFVPFGPTFPNRDEALAYAEQVRAESDHDISRYTAVAV